MKQSILKSTLYFFLTMGVIASLIVVLSKCTFLYPYLFAIALLTTLYIHFKK